MTLTKESVERLMVALCGMEAVHFEIEISNKVFPITDTEEKVRDAVNGELLLVLQKWLDEEPGHQLPTAKG